MTIKFFTGEKGDAIRMTEIGGEVTGEGESKAKANDRAEDTKLENFAEGNALWQQMHRYMLHLLVYSEVCE